MRLEDIRIRFRRHQRPAPKTVDIKLELPRETETLEAMTRAAQTRSLRVAKQRLH